MINKNEKIMTFIKHHKPKVLFKGIRSLSFKIGFKRCYTQHVLSLKLGREQN